MRILYHHRTFADGAEGVHISEIVKAFRSLGHNVSVVSPVGEATPDRLHCDGRCTSGHMVRVKAGLPKCVFRVAEILYNARSYWAVRRQLLRYRPAFLYDRYACFSFGAVLAAKRAGVPIVLEVNTPYATAWEVYDRLYFKRLARKTEERVTNSADVVVVVSSPLRDILLSQDVPSDKILLLPNGVNPDGFNPKIGGSHVRRRYHLEGQTVVGFVGILRPWHGIELLFQAFCSIAADNPEVALLIVGDGPAEQDLKRRATALGIDDRVVFCGRVAHDEVPGYIAAMDIAVSPRAAPHASPMKILEYMAMEVATIAPRMPNIKDLINDGVDGVLFEPEDPAAIARSIVSLTGDVEWRRRLGTLAREKIEKHRNWANNAKIVLRRIEPLCEGRG